MGRGFLLVPLESHIANPFTIDPLLGSELLSREVVLNKILERAEKSWETYIDFIDFESSTPFLPSSVIICSFYFHVISITIETYLLK